MFSPAPAEEVICGVTVLEEDGELGSVEAMLLVNGPRLLTISVLLDVPEDVPALVVEVNVVGTAVVDSELDAGAPLRVDASERSDVQK